jgi:hypothetical protein
MRSKLSSRSRQRHSDVSGQAVIADHIDIRGEVASVQDELLFFREWVLPALFETPLDAVFECEYADWVHEKSNGRLSEWQDATRHLADLLLLGLLAPNAPKLNREDFREFLRHEATPAFCVREGRIIWRIRLFVDPSSCAPYCPTFTDLASVLENLPAHLAEVRQWLMGLPMDSPELANALCMALPFIADADPAFAKLALDPDTWRGLVLNDREISEERRAKRLKCVEGPWFGHVLNNALLHVLGALANNHFTMIEDLLDHPFLIGGYSHLTPSYLLAVLFEKVVILRKLSEERPELW